MDKKTLLSALMFGGDGGGGSNHVQVIQGTVASPWGDMTNAEYHAFLIAYYVGNASATLLVDATALGADSVSLVLNPARDEPDFVALSLSDPDLAAANIFYYGAFMDGENLNVANMITENGGTITDLKPYAELLPTTLTIYWHPMPN